MRCARDDQQVQVQEAAAAAEGRRRKGGEGLLPERRAEGAGAGREGEEEAESECGGLRTKEAGGFEGVVVWWLDCAVLWYRYRSRDRSILTLLTLSLWFLSNVYVYNRTLLADPIFGRSWISC